MTCAYLATVLAIYFMLPSPSTHASWLLQCFKGRVEKETNT